MRRILQIILFLSSFGLAAWIGNDAMRRAKAAQLPITFRRHRIRGLEFSGISTPRRSSLPGGIFSWCVAGCVLGLISLMGNDKFVSYQSFFQASLIGLPKTEFTGTVSPVDKVPKWTALSDGERKMTYAQLPASKFIPLPRYSVSTFQKGLKWSTRNETERNAYITYPVPNMGNYQLDGTENSGSHPGIDIKLPIGTPIKSIASGIVYKVGNQSTGFGKFVAVAHVDVPDPENPGQKTTLISAYAHLSATQVSEGQTVTKGQIIGKSGDTGFATAPHLHFQIDRIGAPFHPYWPFSWSDVQNAGLSSYFDAVRQGLGKSKAAQHTVHPINFIAQYKNLPNTQNLVVSSEPTVAAGSTDEDLKSSAPAPTNPNLVQTVGGEQEPEPKVEEPKSVVVETNRAPEPTVPHQVDLAQSSEARVQTTARRGQVRVRFETDRSFIQGQPETVTLHINREALVASSEIELSSTLRNGATIKPTSLKASDFDNGPVDVIVKTSSSYPFKLVAEGEFGEVKSPSLRPEIFADVPGSYLFADAISYLKEQNIVSGYADGTFKPESTLNRAEALKIILVANSIPIDGRPTDFTDVAQDQWFAKYVGTAVQRAIVKGYGDKTFKPGNTISRAEFLKIAILTAGIEPNPDIQTKSYPDVSADQWFAKFFQFAKDHQLLRVQTGGHIVPNKPITRAEAADVIYRISKIRVR